MMKLKYLLVVCAMASVFNNPRKEHRFSAAVITEAEAGEELVLRFNDQSQSAHLILENAYGKTMLFSENTANGYQFKIPEFMARKSGILRWKFISETSQKTGVVTIKPALKPAIMETYFGPRSIQAGNEDYSMLVSIPTDQFDNPLAAGTKVSVSEYFMEQLTTDTINTQNLFAWKNIYSKEKAGKIIVATASGQLQTKELITNVYPSVASNFEIHATREHNFADGNQLVTLQTEVIKDRFNNIISDGTTVTYIVTTSKNELLTTSATTINGVASGKMLHPGHPDTWRIKGVITGMAESGEILLDFKPVLKDFEISVPPDAHRVKVGPLKSFIGQFIPDGAAVNLALIDANAKILLEMQEQSKDGYAIFNLPKTNNYSEATVLQINALGITKTVTYHARQDQ